MYVSSLGTRFSRGINKDENRGRIKSNRFVLWIVLTSIRDEGRSNGGAWPTKRDRERRAVRAEPCRLSAPSKVKPGQKVWAKNERDEGQ